MASTEHQTALPKGSLILVTGASGYIGSHVVNEALSFGFQVRGSARSEEKAEKTKQLFNNHPNCSTTVVADFKHDGVFDEACKGVDAVIHVASELTFNPDPNKVVTLWRVCDLFSDPRPRKEITVDSSVWNQEALDAAWAPPPYESDRAYAVYAASKFASERAMWDFVKEEKPSFVANAILPDYNMGRILSSAGGTGDGVPSVYRGTIPDIPPQYMIDVINNARLHLIAAAMELSLQGERVFAFNTPFTWAQIVNYIKELCPDAKTVAQAPKDELPDLSKVPNELGAELLKKWFGQETGHKPIRQSIKENLEHVV